MIVISVFCLVLLANVAVWFFLSQYDKDRFAHVRHLVQSAIIRECLRINLEKTPQQSVSLYAELDRDKAVDVLTPVVLAVLYEYKIPYKVAAIELVFWNPNVCLAVIDASAIRDGVGHVVAHFRYNKEGFVTRQRENGVWERINNETGNKEITDATMASS